MRYISTRYANDGGLFMPEYFPKINLEDLNSWRDFTYYELTFEILKLYIAEEDIPGDILRKLIKKAFSRFDITQVARLNFLHDGANILELFHGPTLAFKDFSMSCIGQFMQYFLSKHKKKVIILVGTSGDTGGAAIEAFRSLLNIHLIVLLPKGLCTEIQELQMTTVLEKNIHVFQVEGTSDELDVPIAACFKDPEVCENSAFKLCCLNSINLVRVLVQIIHHSYGYIKLSSVDWDPYSNPIQSLSKNTPNMYGSTGDNLNLLGTSPTMSPDRSLTADASLGTSKSRCKKFKASLLTGENFIEAVIPSGAAGNAVGACIAIQMGIPLKLTLCSNSNDVVARTILSGDFSSLKPFKATTSVSMDIQAPYNMERIIYIYSGRNSHLTTQIMEEFQKYKNVTIPPDLLNEMQKDLRGHFCDEDKAKETILRCWKDNNYILCPHTAIGMSYYYERKDDYSIKYPMFCEATASYLKFPSSVEIIKSHLMNKLKKDEVASEHSQQSYKKLDIENVPPKIAKLKSLPVRSYTLRKGTDWFSILKQKILSISSNDEQFI